MGGDLSGDEVTRNDSLGVAVDEHDVEHLGVLVHRDAAERDLGTQGGVGTEQELLTCLPLGIEGTGDLSAAEGAVCKLSTIFTGEGNAL